MDLKSKMLTAVQVGDIFSFYCTLPHDLLCKETTPMLATSCILRNQTIPRYKYVQAIICCYYWLSCIVDYQQQGYIYIYVCICIRLI